MKTALVALAVALSFCTAQAQITVSPAGGLSAAQVQTLIDAVVKEKLLASVATIATNTAGKQNLYTVPANTKAVITKVVLRKASASLSSVLDAAQLGYTGSDCGSISGGELQALTAVNLATIHYLNGEPSVQGQALVVGSVSDVFGIVFTDTSVTATVTVDVFGYLTNASGVPL